MIFHLKVWYNRIKVSKQPAGSGRSFRGGLCQENNVKILAIDDEYRLLQGLVATIRQVLPDAEVLSYSEVVRANEEIDPKEIDIAFLDIEMRGMNGTAYAEILRKANPRINIIFTTGYSEYSGKAMELHASGYIMKPVTPEKLEKELRDLRYPVPVSSGSGHGSGTGAGGGHYVYGTGSIGSNDAINRLGAYADAGVGGAAGSGAGSIGSAGNGAGGHGSDGSNGSGSPSLTGKATGPGERNVLTVRAFGNFEILRSGSSASSQRMPISSPLLQSAPCRSMR